MYSCLRAGASALAILALAAIGSSSPARAADTKILYGMPVISLAQAWVYVGEAMGYWKELGLDVQDELLGGPQTTNALITGDVQFAAQTPTILISAAHGQNLTVIGNITDALMMELVISKEAADKTGLTVANSTVEQRAKALKGLTLSVDAPGTITDGFFEHVVREGGLDPSKDVTTTPMEFPAAVPAMKAHRIDGFAATPPWTTLAQDSGAGVIWISGVRKDVPDLIPFAYNSIGARRDYCEKNADICRKFVAGMTKAKIYMRTNPEQALALIAPHFKGMDPELLKKSFADQVKNQPDSARYTEAQWENTQKVMLESGLLKPSEKFSKMEGAVYTNAYVQ